MDLLIPPCVVDAAGFECEFTVRAVTIDDARSVAPDVNDRAIASRFDAPAETRTQLQQGP